MAGQAGGSDLSAPANGGEFLLQLLQQAPSRRRDHPPQEVAAAAASAAASPLPVNDHRFRRSHNPYEDPVIAAVGNGIPFHNADFSHYGRQKVCPRPFQLPRQQQRGGFSSPGYFSPEYNQCGGCWRGNREQCAVQQQHLGFASGGADRDRNFGSGGCDRMRRSDVSGFTGRGQLDVRSMASKMAISGQDGRTVNGQVGGSTGSSKLARDSQRRHSHGKSGKGPSSLEDDQWRGNAPPRRNMVGYGRPHVFPSKQKELGHQGWGNCGPAMQNGYPEVVNIEDHRKDGRPPVSYPVKEQTMQRRFVSDVKLQNGRHLMENDKNLPLESLAEKLEDDLHHENDDEDLSRGEEPINGDGLEVEGFSTLTIQSSLQTKQGADPSMVVEEHAEKNELKVNHSRNKDFRSDFSRGQNVSSQRRRMHRGAMGCRRDIKRLSHSFLSIYESLVPPDEELAKQKQLLSLLKKLVSKEWSDAELHLYGSCANSFGASNSDIDVCLVIYNTEMSKPEIILTLADILRSDNLQNVQALIHARVPIVKLMDPITGISCDICVNNVLAVVNTKLLRDYAQIDERLRQLAFLVKHWAKSRDVNEPYQGSLSSYAYVLMCIHFLQQRQPAILPCLQEMETTFVTTIDDVECAYFDKVEELHNYGVFNTESIAELLWGFFNYWAFQHDYAHDVISVRVGCIISKHSKDWTRRIGNDRHLICIEDPFEISHDLGRVVDKHSIWILREEFERAADTLQFDPNPCVTLFERYTRKTSEHELV